MPIREEVATPSHPSSPAGIRRLARTLCGATLVLIVAGGLVTSTRSGLAVPDWPLSFGQLMPEMRGGIFFEHGHRMVAGTVALLTLALLLWIVSAERRPGLRRLALGAAAAVIAQAVLGGLTVLLKLPPQVSIAHATLAQAFFSLTVCLVVATSTDWTSTRPGALASSKAAAQAKLLGILAVALYFGQLVAGAVLRHTGGGVLVHLVGAAVVTTAVLAFAAASFDPDSDSRLRLGAGVSVALLAIQVALGLSALASGFPRPVAIATAHVACGAAMLGAVVHSAVWAARLAPRNGGA